MRTMKRRLALKTAGVLAGAAVFPRRANANERVVMGVMGIRDRGWDLTLEFGQRDDVEIRYLADPDSRLFEERAQKVEQLTGKRAVSWQEANTHIISLMQTNRMLTNIVSVGVLIVAGFGILNVLMMTVIDKLDSIALLKSIGYSRREIMLAYLGLGFGVGLLGVLVGCSVGYYVVEFLGTVPIPRLAVLDTHTLLVNNLPRHYLLAGGVALVVSMLAAILPAMRAGQLDPVAILRGHS